LPRVTVSDQSRNLCTVQPERYARLHLEVR
jgi:hypothetical protein